MFARRPLSAWLLLPLAVVACGDDEGESTSSSSSTSTSASSGTTSSTTTGSASTGSGGGGGGGEGAGIQIPDLEGPVTATVDELGVLHLTCAADDDCFAALGWFHAQNRFFFMDFVRNLVRGSLGSLVSAGPIVLEQDFDNRRFFCTREGEPLERALYEQASDRVRGHLDAYTRGVNAWIGDMRAGRNGATLTTEYDFAAIVKDAIRDWEPEDSAAVGLYVLADLSNNGYDELGAGEVQPAYEPAFGEDLFSGVSLHDAFTAPLDVGARPAGPTLVPGVTDALRPHRALLGEAKGRLARVASGPHRPGDIGSNNWLVAPERSASGGALLANDPHLSLTNPSIWFPAEIDARSEGDGDYHMAGGTFPGLPAVLIGHNESLAWGVTTAYWDLADVYLEELTPDGSAVVFDGDEVPIVERTFEFADVLSGETQERTFRWVPHHGPILAEDLDAGTAVTLRWRGQDGGRDLDAFFSLGRAATVAEARAGLAENASSASQNFIVTDAAGDVGWFPFARVPERSWASPALPAWLPLPGDGSAEWGPPVAVDDLPQLENPVTGVIATANQDMTGAWADGDPTNDDQPALQARGKAEGTRQQRILDLLEAGGDAHDVESMRAAQADTRSLYGEIVTPLLLEVAAASALSPEAEVLVAALEDWGYTCPTGIEGSDPESGADVADEVEAAEAIGCTAFHLTLWALGEGATRDEAEAAGVDYDPGLGTTLVARAIAKPESLLSGEALWDDVGTDFVETRDMVVRDALEATAALLADVGEPDAWRWGRHHTLILRSIFDNFGVGTYNEGPYAAPGALSTVNVAGPRFRTLPESAGALDLGFGAGPSLRVVTEQTEDGPRMSFSLPGGADLHRESPFYNNLLPAWLEVELAPFHFGPGAVEDPAEVIEVTPAP